MEEEQHKDFIYVNSNSKSTIIGIITGLITGVLVIPVSFSFAAIIFRSQEFSSSLSSLSKLVLISSAIHQLCFSFFSSLPFAIGQVQDAGLVFLAAIADSIATSVRSDQIIPTTLVILPICSALLGLMLILVGKLKLANLIQYLPMPVIGGYLAFIGFFCGQAGLSLMSNVELYTILDWYKLCTFKSIMLITPGILLGIFAYILVRNIKSPFVLPIYMIFILTFFFTILLITGYTIDEARNAGWIAPLTPAAPFYEIYSLFDFSKVDLSQLPRQSLRVLGMFLVVSFSSSLDVAAIEMELGLPLDYDREMETVGRSNLISGILGGYTGSYIFSQTIFTMRRGILTRSCGYTVAILEIIFFLLPISITSYIPKCFFGSLLVLISSDLLFEWLVAARKKMLETEYLVCILTFISIQATGIEIGMTLGILCAMLGFVLTYSSSSDVSSTSVKSSTVVRTFEERQILIASRGKIVTISLQGYIFFGSAVKILNDVKKHLVLNTDNNANSGNNQVKESYGDDVVKKPMFRYTITPTKKAVNFNSPALSATNSESKKDTDNRYELVENEDEEIGLTLRVDDDHDKRSRPHSESINSLSSYGSVETPNSLDSPTNSKRSSPTMVNKNLNSISIYDLSAADIGKHHQHWEDSKSNTVNDNRKHETELRNMTATSSLLHNLHNFNKISNTDNNKNNNDNNDNNDNTSAELFLKKLFATGNDGQPDSIEEIGATSDDSGFTEYVVLDFTLVVGVDATAARSCFLMLMQLMRCCGITVAFTGLATPIENLLRAHRVIKDDDVVIKVLDDCLEWFEEQILFKANGVNTTTNSSSNSLRRKSFSVPSSSFKRDKEYYATAWLNRKQLRHPVSNTTSLASTLSLASMRFSEIDLTNEVEVVGTLSDKKSTLESPKSVRILRRILCDYLEVEATPNCPLYQYLRSKTLIKYFERKVIAKNEVIIDIGDKANNIFIIEEGSVEITRDNDYYIDDTETIVHQRLAKLSAGAVFGEESFFLRTKFQYRYSCLIDCYLWTMSREAYSEMEHLDSKLCLLIQHVLLKSLSLTQNKLINE